MRYELGDKLDTFIFYPPGPIDPGTPGTPVKTDHRARFLSLDQATFDASYDVPVPTDTENPLAALIVVFVPVGVAMPTVAAEFLDPQYDGVFHRARAEITPDRFGSTVVLNRPEGIQPGTAYLGQTLHGYAD